MQRDFPLKALSAYPDNPRKNESAISAIEASLEQFGPVSPIIADEHGRICAGHTRFAAAQRQGRKTFPVIICSFPDDKSFKAYNIADNQTAAIAEWDNEKLAAILADLKKQGFPVPALGFEPKEFEHLVSFWAGKKSTPAPQHSKSSKSTARPGDVWLLGPHRLVLSPIEPINLAEELIDFFVQCSGEDAVRESDGASWLALRAKAGKSGRAA